jgi:hypothetical protein
MIYPNIQIVSNKDNMYYCNITNSHIKTNRYQHLRNYFNLDNSTAVVILSQIVVKYKNIIKYLKEKNISNVYFFIDDCFRNNLNNQFKVIDNSYREIDIIIKIIEKSNIKKHKVFHCEMLNHQIKNLDIKYADLFLYDWIKSYSISLLPSFNFNYKLSCVNNRGDIHRHLIGAFLCNRKDVFLTLNEHVSKNEIFENKSINLKTIDTNLSKIITNNLEYLAENKIKYVDKKNKKNILSLHHQHSQHVLDIIQNSFVNVVTETLYATDSFFMTEKTIKPIQCLRPFVTLSVPNTLEKLHKFGFKTFSQWWDESYDQETDHTKRFQKVCTLLEHILSKSNSELKTMLYEMSETLHHNYNNLNNFKKQLLP